MGLQKFLNILKSKRSLIEGSQTNIPVAGQSQTLAEVFDRYLDENNYRQLAVLTNEERAISCIIDAYNWSDNEYDVDGFLDRLTFNIFLTSASIGGYKSNVLQNVAVGQLHRDYQLEIAEARHGTQKNELKEVL